MHEHMIAGLVLFAAAVAYRLLPLLLGMKLQQPEWLPNFSPMAALCLCGAAFLPRRLAIVLPFIALLGTDLVLNAHYGFPLFTVEFLAKTIAFAAVTGLGWQLRKNTRAGTILPAVMGGSLFFYIATNTASWLYEPGYAKTAAGWIQALTTGLPGYAPTWIFYRNTLAGDVLFASLFLVCMHWSRRPASATAPEPIQATR
jgi:branched-subunit amino acid transport protein